MCCTVARIRKLSIAALVSAATYSLRFLLRIMSLLSKNLFKSDQLCDMFMYKQIPSPGCYHKNFSTTMRFKEKSLDDMVTYQVAYKSCIYVYISFFECHFSLLLMFTPSTFQLSVRFKIFIQLGDIND